MKKNITSVVASAFLLLGSIGHADINQFLNDAVVQANGAKSIKTDTGTLLYGGGLQMRAKTVNIQPFSVSAPSIKAGCGGIDATLGALSYLDMDQIVSLLEGMMANAPGVMFEMALKVICPSCMDTLNALNDMANQINGINGNSCAATKAVAGWMENSLKGSVVDGSESDFNKALKSFNAGVRSTTQDIAQITSFLSNSGCNPNDKACGARFFMKDVGTNSLLNYAMAQDNVDTYISSSTFIPFMRYFSGDIVKIPPTGDGANKAHGKIKFYEPAIPGLLDMASSKGVNDAHLAKSSVDTNSLNLLKQLVGEPTTEAPMVRLEDGSFAPFGGTGTLKSDFTARLTSIQNKIITRSALSSDDIGFLSMFNLPVYLITNKLASMPSGDMVLESIKDDLALMLSYEIAYEYLQRTASVAARQKEKMDSDSINAIDYKCDHGDCYGAIREHLTWMQQSSRSMSQIAYKLASEKYNDVSNVLEKNIALIEGINNLQQFTLQRSNPRLFENYMFAKTLTTSGG